MGNIDMPVRVESREEVFRRILTRNIIRAQEDAYNEGLAAGIATGILGSGVLGVLIFLLT